MSGSRFFDRIAWSVTALTLVLTVLFMNGTALGMEVMARSMGYENRLFDHTKVHTIDIVMDEWDDFIANATSEEYYSANVVIDGEAYKNIGIRAKGNTSLSTVASLGSRRYSFKIEFDHYDSSKSYHGLDKLSLNNLIQDSTMMKDYLTYIMMNAFGVNSSLCSYVYITVNGEDWGLYLAVEGVEEAFLERNYGSDYGELYKPDSLSFGGGRGNGKAFEPPAEFDGSDGRKGGFNLGGGFGMGSSDVKLQYTDDDLDSYSNIWNNAKTDITEADQYRLIESLKKLSAGEEIESVVDIEQVIRYFVVHNYICNDDSYTGMMVHNYYLYEKDGQLAMIPWDYNLGFGTFTSGDATDTVNTPIDNPVSGGSSDRPMLNWIFENETYTGLYHEYFSAFIHTVDIEGIIEEAYHLIQSYVEKDPTAFYTYEEFETGLETLRRFCSLRSESISMQLESGETSENMNYADASAITLADMGSMEGGKGGFRGSMSGRPSENTPIEAMSGGSSESMSSETMPSENMPPNMPDKFTETMQMPRENFTFDMNGADAPSSDLTGWIWMAFSAVILAAGLIVARKYKS
jgi:spore coat protein CotH